MLDVPSLVTPNELNKLNNSSKQIQHIVVIGAGMAGTRFAMSYAKERLPQDTNFTITLINSEPHAGYNRIMLSPVLAGEKAFDEIFLYPKAEYDCHHIRLKIGCSVTHIDTTTQLLTTDTGDTLAYDKLVFATGSNPFILPLPNSDADGVMAFRTKADVDKMLALVNRQSANCVVIGGGFLGLEAGNALANHGANVTVVHSSDYLLNRQLDKTAGQLLQQHFEKKGINFLLNANSQVIEINQKNHVTGLTVEIADNMTSESHTLPADCVIMTVGVRPNIELAKQAGIACGRGILVDSQMQTHTPNVYAIGECVEFDSQLFGLVAPVYEQADILIHTLLQKGEKQFSVKPTATKLKVSGVDLFSAGDIEAGVDCETLLYHDPARAIYQKLTLKNNRIKSAVLYGDVGDGAWFFDLIQNQQDIKSIKDKLLFGQAFCQDFC